MNDFWDPWREYGRLQHDLRHLLRGMPATRRDFPPVNVFTNEEGALITTELPGLKPDDIQISVLGDTLTLKGQRNQPGQRGGHTFHRRERGFGEFSRTIQVPFRIEAAKVVAQFKRGVLEIQAPKSAADRPRAITVRAS